jgi:hypothetical protein
MQEITLSKQKCKEIAYDLYDVIIHDINECRAKEHKKEEKIIVEVQ